VQCFLLHQDDRSLHLFLGAVALLDGPKEPRSSEQNGIVDGVQTHDSHSDATISIPLRSINVVATHVPFIEDAQAKVTAEMESMVLTGLSTLSRAKCVCTQSLSDGRLSDSPLVVRGKYMNP
jgi:hypothetical protein